MKDTPPPPRGKGVLVIPALSIALILLLAASWLIAGDLVARMPALVVAAGRTGTAFVALTAIAMLNPARRPAVRVAASRPGAVALLGLLGFFGYYAGTMIGTGMIGASRIGLITSLLPCITFAIGAVAFQEPVTRLRVAGTILAMIGACGYVLADGRPHGPGSQGGLSMMLGGALLGFAGTASYALYGYVFRGRMGHLPAMSALPAIPGAGTIMLGAAALLFAPLGAIASRDWAELAILGALFTAPVFILLHELILRKGPLFTAGLSLTVPFVLRMGGWAVGQQGAPGWIVLALLASCAAGVWLVIRQPRTPAKIVRRER